MVPTNDIKLYVSNITPYATGGNVTSKISCRHNLSYVIDIRSYVTGGNAMI